MSPIPMPMSQRIRRIIIDNPHVDHRRVTFTSESGRVLIRGTAKTYYEKQMAQEALRNITGIQLIENQLDVVTG